MPSNPPVPPPEVITRADIRFPQALFTLPESEAPDAITAIGDLSILSRPKLGVFCSIRCPGSLVLAGLDAAQQLRDAGITTIGGWHTPMEKDILDILIRGKQGVVLCPARGLAKLRLAGKLRGAVAEDRSLILSPFGESDQRITKTLAERRNRFVAALAEALLLVHAAPGGKTEQLADVTRRAGRVVMTIDDPANSNLLERGACPLSVPGLRETALALEAQNPQGGSEPAGPLIENGRRGRPAGGRPL